MPQQQPKQQSQPLEKQPPPTEDKIRKKAAKKEKDLKDFLDNPLNLSYDYETWKKTAYFEDKDRSLVFLATYPVMHDFYSKHYTPFRKEVKPDREKRRLPGDDAGEEWIGSE